MCVGDDCVRLKKVKLLKSLLILQLYIGCGCFVCICTENLELTYIKNTYYYEHSSITRN